LISQCSRFLYANSSSESLFCFCVTIYSQEGTISFHSTNEHLILQFGSSISKLYRIRFISIILVIMTQTVVLKVGMSCQGCVGAVNRVLGKMEGVESFDIDIKEQKVTVKGNVEPEAVFQTVSKTGKKTSFWPVEAEAEPKTEADEAVTETKTEAETKSEAPKVDVEPKVAAEAAETKPSQV
ncbi:hypothetical protein CARUB_v10018096mg, partial [Capsella rubella]